jgi:hypothetical protein
MNQTGIDGFPVTRHAADARADGGTRLVHVRADRIVIKRTLRNVQMTVAVPVIAYKGLVIAARLQVGTATLYLRHDDQDLDVALMSGDAIEVAQKARGWGALFDKPIAIEEVGVNVFQPFGRERHKKPSRRSSFARRREVGVPERTKTSFRGEREIIART